MRVYLADLRHDYSGVLSTDGMPLGIGYMKGIMDRQVPDVRSELFVYPERLLSAIRRHPPDVLMLSNYVWNEALSLHVASVMKRIRPDTLLVLGGPNIHLEDDRRLAYVAEQPDVDLYVLGEGDFVASEIVVQFLECDRSLDEMAIRDLPSTMRRRPDGTIARSEDRPRPRALDEIPSPFLDGTMDAFFDGRLAPMLETNRGCPFSCTFCAQGTSYYTKVNYFSVERVTADLTYMASRVAERCPGVGALIIADPNYGMFERDAEISAHLAALQVRYGWPTYISASTGKNRADRIIRSIEPVSTAISFRQALQSTNPVTLQIIKRDNIKLRAYEDVMRHVQGRGMRSVSDLILGLPGETLASHLDAIRQVVDAGTHELHNFQAMLLKGTELETRAARSKYRMTTRFRVLPANFGVYESVPVFDSDEIVVATDTLSFDDYLAARIYGLGFSVFWNNSWFNPAIALGVRLGVRRSEMLDAMVAELERSTGSGRRFLDAFLVEMQQELFERRETAIAFYSEPANLERITAGEIGNNLMYKYRSIASFLIWPAICEVGLNAIRDVIRERWRHAPDCFEPFWAALAAFLRHQHADGRTLEMLTAPVTATLPFDIPKWVADGSPIDLFPYRLSTPQPFEFRLNDGAAEKLRRVLTLHQLTLNGLTKAVTRIRAEWQVRDCIPVAAGRPAA